jgi:hypothetical protein
MPRTLILNQTNIVGGTGNSVLQYDFPQGGVNFADEFIAVQQVSFYQSVFNITQANNNNQFAYTWIDNTSYTITIPDGYYELATIYAFFRDAMTSNKHYLQSGSNFVYLIQLVVNPTKYADQVNCFPISTSIATAKGWTVPSGATWVLPTNNIVPIFTVLNNDFKNVIGFNVGNYPNATIKTTLLNAPPNQIQTPTYTSTQIFLSTQSPQLIPQPSYLCLCSLVNNRLGIPSQLIYSITPANTTVGSIYLQQVSDMAFNKIENGNYTNFRFSFVDQQGKPIIFQDPNMLILLVIKSKNELGIV